MRAALAYIASAALMIGCQDQGGAATSDLPLTEEAIEEASAEPAEPPPSNEAMDLPPSSAATESPVDAVVDGADTENLLPMERSDEAPVAELQDTATAPRDLAAELRGAVGKPNDCLQDFERASPTTIQVTLSALVRSSGALTQVTAAAHGLSPQARQCIARQAEAVTLQPLAAESSQRISTVIEIEYVPPSATARGVQAGAPDPQLRNVREPLPKRPEVAPSGRPIQDPTSRPIQDPKARPIQEPSSRKVRGPQPRPIDGWDVDENAKEWR